MGDVPRSVEIPAGVPQEQTRYRLFAELVRGELPLLLATACAIVGTSEGEDAAQEAILRGWQALPSLHNLAAIRPWVLRITVNLCLDWLRGAHGTRLRRIRPLAGDEPIALLSVDPGTSDHTGALDLRRAVNTLETDLRMVVVLRYYAGMDATEIGAALGIPAPTVRTRLRRALTLLRERLEEPRVLPARDERHTEGTSNG